MKTKHKRLIIIGICIAWGMFSALSFLLAPGTSPLSLTNSGLTQMLFLIAYFSLPALYVESFIERAMHINITSNAMAYTYFFSTQFVISFIIGGIIAFLIYPPSLLRKAEPRPSAHAKAGQ